MVRIAETDRDLEGVFALRYKVFVDEQKVPEDMERDEFDADAVHVIAEENSLAVGTGRMVIEGTKGRIGRMAVDVNLRGKGIGRNIMLQFEKTARELKLIELYLHAQTHASEFYRNLGYIPRGELFEEAGIEHVEMFKTL